jgi:hypothetical protein
LRSIGAGRVYNQKPSLGFPIARIGAITSLACGAVVNLGFCRYAGKGQGEVSLLRRLWGVLVPGDVLLADRLTSNWATIHLLHERGVELRGTRRRSRKPTPYCPLIPGFHRSVTGELEHLDHSAGGERLNHGAARRLDFRSRLAHFHPDDRVNLAVVRPGPPAKPVTAN